MERVKTLEQPARPRPIAGKYEILDELGAAAGGTIYRVRHTLLDSVLTLTVLGEEMRDSARLARVQDAVRRSAQLRHDHIVPVLDFGEDAGEYHVVEAAVDGELLGATDPLPPVDALQVARQIADALAYAHERGVVHGALSPASVLVERTTAPRAMLRGFLTASTASALAPGYAAPELLAGKPADVASDIFALGLVIFELFEGKPFFSGTPEAIEDILLRGTGPLLPQFSQIAPSGLSGLIGRAIRRAPADRQRTMAQVRDELDACLRRLGQRTLVSRRTVAPDAPVRRHALVVDDAVEEMEIRVGSPDAEDAPAPTPELPAARKRSAVKVTPEPDVAQRPLGAGTGMVARSRPRTPIAGKVIVAIVVVALAWPLVRSLTSSDPTPVAPETPPSGSPAMVPAVLIDELAMDLGAPVVAPAPLVPSVTAPGETTSAEVAAASDQTVSEDIVAMGPAPAPNVAPRIANFRPAATDVLNVTEGRSLDFSIRATDRNPDDRFVYAWFVDGKKSGRGPTWRFVATPGSAGTSHTVAAEVADAAGLKAPRVSWKLEVTARMSEVDVRDWLGRLTAAWERKDIPTLRLYGVVATDQEAAAVRKRLGGQKDLRVSVGNETIRTDRQYATVGFDVAEYGKGGKLLGSRRELFELEKQPNGFVGLRAR